MSEAEEAEFCDGPNGWFESIVKNDEPRVRELMVRADFSKEVSIIDIFPDFFFFILVYFFFLLIYLIYFFSCSWFVWNERKGNRRIDWRGERMIGLIYLFNF